MLKSVPTLGMSRWLRASIKREFTKTAWFGAVGAPPKHKDEGSVCAAHSPYCLGDKKGYKKEQKRVMTYLESDILV
jgi:hypothetical protein